MKILYVGMCLLAAIGPGFASEEPAAHGDSAYVMPAVLLTPEYLSQLADEMRTNQPALRAAFLRTNIAAAGVNAVRTWEDPMAKLGGMAAREEMRADEGDIIYGVEQKLPLFGKPGLARSVARAALATEVANAEYQFQTQRSTLAKSAFAAALADQVVVIGAQDLEWLNSIAVVVDSKFRAGQATLVETLSVENERARRGTQLQADRDELAHHQVGLNRLLNRDLSSHWPPLEMPPVPGEVHFNQRLLSFAMNNEPKLRMLQQQIHEAEASVALTRRERMPDMNVGLEARNYSGDGSFRQGMLTFSMNLPWVNNGKYRSDLKRDEAKLNAAELDLTDYQLSVREEVHRLTVKINSARREALLYRDQIIPRTQSALESARANWEGNQGSFRDLLDARRMLLDARLMYVRALSEQYQMMSELVLCCGLGELGALSMIGAEPDSSSKGDPHEK